MPTITGSDPGVATGWAWGDYSDTQPFELEGAWITADFKKSCSYWHDEYGDELVVERFVLRNRGFVPNIEGVKLEGVIEDTWEQHFKDIYWQTPSFKGKAGEMDAVLKRIGMWQTGKMVGHKDGRDANDAIIHILKRMIIKRHIPTLEAYFPDLI
jgi:hypothetical protein